MLYIYIFLVAFLLLCAFIHLKSSLVCVSAFIVLTLIYANCLPVSDLAEYQRIYDIFCFSGRAYHANEPLFIGIMTVGKLCKFSFNEIRVVIFAVSLLLCTLIVVRIGGDQPTFLLPFSLYSFFIEGLQIRGFLALSILCAGFYAAYYRRKNSWLLLASVILATLIQRTFVLYLALLIVLQLDLGSKKGRYISCLITVFMFAFQYYNGLLSELVSLDAEGAIYAAEIVRNGWIIAAAMLALLLLLRFYLRTIVRREGVLAESVDLFSAVDCLYVFNLMCMPLCLVNLSFYRYTRYSYFILTFLCSLVASRCNDSKYRVLLQILVVITSILFMLMDCTIHGSLGDTILYGYFHVMN